MVELRRKNKPTPAEFQPPADPEEWIARANADGEPFQPDSILEKRVSRSSTKRARKQPQPQEIQSKPTPILPSMGASLAASRYISFSIDNITHKLFREICFNLNMGNVQTLSLIITQSSAFSDSDFSAFHESQMVCGNLKRVMSFQLSEVTINLLQKVAHRLHYRNKSALCRYLIQHHASRSGIKIL